jgi:hypothetical protein
LLLPLLHQQRQRVQDNCKILTAKLLLLLQGHSRE